MAFLVHAQNGRGLLTGLVDEFAPNGMIRALPIDPLHGLVVKHLEIATNPHAAIGGNMALEVALGNKDAAHPCSRWVISGLHVFRSAPCAVIGLGVRVVVADGDLTSGLTAANHHIRRVREIPHELLRTLGIIRVLLRLISIPGCSRDEIVGDIVVLPPKTPTVMEIDGLSVCTSHVNHHGSVIRYIDELEIDTRVVSPTEIQVRCGQVEHLHALAGVGAGEGDQLFLIQIVVEHEGIACVPVLTVVIFVNRVIASRRRGARGDGTGRRQFCSVVQVFRQFRDLALISGVIGSVHIGQIVGLVPYHQVGIDAENRRLRGRGIFTAQTTNRINA